MSKTISEAKFFHLCMVKGNAVAVREALEAQPELATGVDTCRTREGGTPLFYASGSGDEEIVGLLLERNADVNARDENGWTPLHNAAARGCEKVARMLLEHGAEVNARERKGRAPLLSAIVNGYKEMVRLFLEYGADVDVQGSSGWTPLHYGCWDDCEELVCVLLEHGADRGIKNYSGKSVRNMTEHGYNREILALLVLPRRSAAPAAAWPARAGPSRR